MVLFFTYRRLCQPSDGREVAILERGWKEAGTHRVEWLAENAPSGAYVARLIANGHTREVKLVVTK